MATKTKLELSVENFRSIPGSSLDLRPITVLTGANGAGKSSFMYAIMTLKNLLMNSNQAVDSLFNFGFCNLGGFKEVVLEKETHKHIHLQLHFVEGDIDCAYTATLGPSPSLQLTVKHPVAFDLKVDVTFPYPLFKTSTKEIVLAGESNKITFNGVGVTIAPSDAARPHSKQVQEALYASTMVPIAVAQRVEYVEVKRGFFRSTYAPVPAGVSQSGEEAVASMLASDRDLEARVSVALEKMMNKSFAARHTALGVPTFYLQTTDRETGFVCDLVNEGFGVNQLIYLLAKALQKNSWFVCIEEPETHLHPQVLEKLAEQLLIISRRENRRFLVASHSEHFVVSLLNLVAQKKATPDDLGIYFLAKDEKNFTRAVEQKVNEKGQIEGGLKSFYEPTIRALEEFLGPETNKEHVNPSK